jgi:ABC-type phosphate transport system substrate-binding protein
MFARRALLLSLLAALTTLCATGLGQQRPAPQAPAFQVIVNPGNDAAALDRTFVEDAFLKKITTWPSGAVIRPVDLAPDSPVRRAFSHDVLNRSVDAVKGYWQQRIFSGRDVPPPEFGTDEEIISYVLKHDGGIGYVSATAKLNGCRVVVIR